MAGVGGLADAADAVTTFPLCLCMGVWVAACPREVVRGGFGMWRFTFVRWGE